MDIYFYRHIWNFYGIFMDNEEYDRIPDLLQPAGWRGHHPYANPFARRLVELRPKSWYFNNKIVGRCRKVWVYRIPVFLSPYKINSKYLSYLIYIIDAIDAIDLIYLLNLIYVICLIYVINLPNLCDLSNLSNQPINQSIDQSINLSIYLSSYLPI